jgi:hypothetical protein
MFKKNIVSDFGDRNLGSKMPSLEQEEFQTEISVHILLNKLNNLGV